MSPLARKKYHGEFWPAACAAKGWKRNDEAKRRAIVLECMQLVRGPLVTTSDPEFDADETTALFAYLAHLAHPESLDLAAAWVDCMKDYHAFNRARQADWHEVKTYGRSGSKRLRKQRFGGKATAVGDVLEPFDPAAVNKRFVTMAARHRAKQKREASEANLAPIAENLPREDAPENGASSPDPVYIAPEESPF